MEKAPASTRQIVRTSEAIGLELGRRQRILLLSPHIGTTSHYAPHAELLAEHLRLEGISVSIADINPLNYTNGHQTLLTKLKHFGGDQWASMRSLYRTIGKHDIVHVFAVPPSEFAESSLHALVMAKYLGKHTVLSLMGGNIEDTTNKFGGFLVPSLRLANKIVVSSDQAARHLARHGLPVAVAAPASPEDIAPRHIDSVQPKILTVVSAGPDSNISTLLRAYVYVKQKYPRIELTVVGPAKRLKAFEHAIPPENGVTFVCTYDPAVLKDLWLQSDVYVNPSSDDDFPIGVLEAIRTGLPVISADAPGINQVIRDRADGLIFPANDYISLADKIIELIEQPALVAQLSRAAVEDSRRYDWQVIRQQWLPLYARK